MKKILFLCSMLFLSMGGFAQPATCPVVSSPGISNATAATIDLDWIAGGSETAWNIEYDATGFTLGDGTIATATGTPGATLTDLVPASAYDYYIQADCGNGDLSTWAGPFHFTTPCIAPVISMFPWTEDFDATEVDEMPCGWAVNNVNGDDETWFTNNYSSASGDNALYISYNGNEDMNDWAFTPELVLEAGTIYTLTFDYNTNSDDEYVENMGIHIGNAQTVAAMTTSLDVMESFYATEFQHKQLVFTVPADGSYHIGFHGYSIANQYYIMLDNINVAVTPCPMPAQGIAEDISFDGAHLNWTAGYQETQWNIEYGPAGFTPGDGIVIPAQGTPDTTISGLTPVTTYDYYVQANCGTADQSEWAGPFSFTTVCTAITTFPWTENFDATELETLPCGWAGNDANDDETTWYTSDYNAASGDNSLYIEYNSSEAMNDWAFTPELVLEAGTTYMLTFEYSTDDEEDYEEKLAVHIGNAQTPAAMTNLLNDMPRFRTLDFLHKQIVFTVPANGSYYIGFHGYSYEDQLAILLDDITVDLAPSCPTPTDLSVDNMHYNHVNLNWAAGYQETQWNIEYGEAGFTPGDGILISAQGTSDTVISGLTELTSYAYYVQANCGTADESEWIGPFTFTTPCIPPVISMFPWTEDFDAVNVPELPCGWMMENTNGDFNGIWSTQDYNASSGDNALGIQDNDNEDMNDWVFTPALSLAAGTAYKLSFDYATDYDPENLSVYIGNAQTGVAMTTLLRNIAGFENTDFETALRVFDVPADGDYFIGFHGYSEADMSGISLDNITVDIAPDDCYATADLSIENLTATTVDLGWIPGFNETNWNIEYGTEGFVPGEGTTLHVQGTPDTTLAGLTELTTYEYYVQANCGETSQSEWTGPFTFTTPCIAPIISTYPWSEDFETAETPDMLCGWTSENANDDFEAWETYAFQSNSGNNSLYMEFDYDNEMNDWAYTPAFVMQAGTIYKLSFAYAAGSDEYTEELKVAVGTSQSSAAMTTTLTDLSFSNEAYDTVVVAFTPTVTAAYFFGLQAHSVANTSSISVDDMHVCEAENASFTLPQDTICLTAIPVFPVVTGVTGGRFSGTPGLHVDAMNGAIVPSVSTTGTHQLTYISSTGPCAGTSSMTVVIRDCTLGIDEAASLTAVELYPNPTNGIFHIRTQYAADLQITLLDFTGKTIELPVSQPAAGEFEMDLSTLSNGVYLVKLTNKDGQQIRRIALNK
jgi:hypothetical protein